MSEADPMRWVLRGVAAGTLVLGWVFIAWQNNFHLTVPVVIICLGYLALVATIANLWRIGVTAVALEDDSPDAWTRPLGARDELEKEKKTLLKAIKEAEFDLAMGKLSKADADELSHTYRTRAIEVIKEIDRLDAGAAGTTREQIQREVQARLALDSKASPKDIKKKAGAKAKGDEAKAKGDDAKAKGNDAKAKSDDATQVAKGGDVKTDDARRTGAPAEPPPEPVTETQDDASEAIP